MPKTPHIASMRLSRARALGHRGHNAKNAIGSARKSRRDLACA
jgi:hypothetical protein